MNLTFRSSFALDTVQITEPCSVLFTDDGDLMFLFRGKKMTPAEFSEACRTEIETKSFGFSLLNAMKMRNFVQINTTTFERRFTRIYQENGNLFIGHSINDKKTPIEVEHLDEWIKYFDRI